MTEFGRRQIKRAIKEQLSESGTKQIHPAHHFCYLHRGIVGHNRQLVGWDVVFAPDNEVSKIDTSDCALLTGHLIEEL